MTQITIMTTTLATLHYNCIWPGRGNELSPEKYFKIRFLMLLTLAPFSFLCSTAHLIMAIKNNSSHNLTEDIVVMLAQFGVLYFVFSFFYYQNGIATVYSDLSDLTRFGKPSGFDRNNALLNRFSKWFRYYLFLVVIMLGASPFLEAPCYEEGWGEICGVMTAAWMPFTPGKFLRTVFYFWQGYSYLFTFMAAGTISYGIMESIAHTIMKINHLKMLLKEAIDNGDKVLFAKCVEYHNFIFSIGNRMDKYYTSCLFVHVIISGALFGCIGYRTTESFSLNSFSIFSGWLISLCVVCFSGQLLIDSGMSVGEAAYNSEWYNNDVYFQKTIIPIMVKSTQPCLIHAGPLTFISHSILVSIFKTAYTYMTFLNVMRS